MFGLQEKKDFIGLGSAVQDSDMFSGHFFQNSTLGKSDPLTFSLLALLDCQMVSHRLDGEIHQQRCDELRDIEKRIKAG
jgi:hypothetical protein